MSYRNRIAVGVLSVWTGFGAGAALADAPEPEQAAGEVTMSGGVEHLLVTGTQIRDTLPDSSQLIVYDRDDIERSGATTVEQFIRKIPQNFALLDASTLLGNGDNPQAVANTSAGATLNLRGVGTSATLVLINGRRLAPAGSDGSFMDVSMIPLRAIDRIEILTDGASAIYGADAIAGVVNFILRRDFQGAETAMRYGDSAGGGATERGASQMLGHAWESGNALLIYERHEQDSLLAQQRDFVPDELRNLEILPEQRRDSVFTGVRQDLPSSFDLFAEAMFSRRSFEDRIPGGGLTADTGGSSQQTAGAAGVGYDFVSGWRAELIANFSSADADQKYDYGIFGTQRTGTRTEVLSGELHADGGLFELPGGMARASFGAGVRREDYTDVQSGIANLGRDLSRTVLSGYGEFSIPLIGPGNALRWAKQLKLSLAAHADEYDNGMSSMDPKFGIVFSPFEGLNLRSSYSTSFRAPLLVQTADAQRVYQAFPLPNPAAPFGMTPTLIGLSQSNPDLDPEESTSLAVGFDFKPPALPGLSVSASWFRMDFTGRIGAPPYVGSPIYAFMQMETLAPFIDLSPDPAELQRIFAEEIVVDPLGLGAASMQAVFDLRLRNIAETATSGMDFSVRYDLDSRLGEFGFRLAGTYIDTLDMTPAPTAPTVEVLNTIFNPVDLRLQAGVSWSRNGLSAAAGVDYFAGYRNNLADPVEELPSWNTVDLQVGYRTGQRPVSHWLKDIAVMLNVQNALNATPPAPSGDGNYQSLGYDPTNADPRGRFFSLQLLKTW